MIKTWYSAKEAAGLHGMSKLGFIKMAKRKGYETRHRSGKGGGLEYRIDCFPVAVVAKIAEIPSYQADHLLTQPPLLLNKVQNQITVLSKSGELSKAEGDAKAAALDGKARLRMDTRLEVLRQFERYCAQENASHCKFGGKYHKAAFAIAWNKGEIASSARDLIPILSSDKLTRWRKQCQREGLARLAGKDGHRKGQTLIDTQPQLVAALKALLCVYPHVSPGIAHSWLIERYETQVLEPIRKFLFRYK